jgi:hypothetical protein
MRVDMKARAWLLVLALASLLVPLLATGHQLATGPVRHSTTGRSFSTARLAGPGLGTSEVAPPLVNSPRLAESRASARSIRWLLAFLAASGSLAFVGFRRRSMVLRLRGEGLRATRAPTRAPPVLSFPIP